MPTVRQGMHFKVVIGTLCKAYLRSWLENARKSCYLLSPHFDVAGETRCNGYSVDGYLWQHFGVVDRNSEANPFISMNRLVIFLWLGIQRDLQCAPWSDVVDFRWSIERVAQPMLKWYRAQLVRSSRKWGRTNMDWELTWVRISSAKVLGIALRDTDSLHCSAAKDSICRNI